MGFISPEKILKGIRLQDNAVVADFGCGSGGWVLPLAKMLETGNVFAIDILPEPLSALKLKAKTEGISNIETICSNVEKKRGSKLYDSSCDLVLMTNLFSQCDKIEIVMEEGIRVLKKGGRILVCDWKEASSLGPKNKISLEAVKELAKKMKLKAGKELEAGDYHYGIILTK